MYTVKYCKIGSVFISLFFVQFFFLKILYAGNFSCVFAGVHWCAWKIIEQKKNVVAGFLINYVNKKKSLNQYRLNKKTDAISSG